MGQAQAHLLSPVQAMAASGRMWLSWIRYASARSARMRLSLISSLNKRSYFKVSNPCSRDPFCPGRPGPGPNVRQLRVELEERLESERVPPRTTGTVVKQMDRSRVCRGHTRTRR